MQLIYHIYSNYERPKTKIILFCMLVAIANLINIDNVNYVINYKIAGLIQQNTIYQFINKNGDLVVTNHWIKGAKLVTLSQVEIKSIPPIKFIDPSTNQSNDISIGNINNANRNEVLKDELLQEEKALKYATNILTYAQLGALPGENQTEYLDRIKALNESIIEHTKNIQLLNQLLD